MAAELAAGFLEIMRSDVCHETVLYQLDAECGCLDNRPRSGSRSAPSAAARRFNSYALTSPQSRAELSRHFLNRAIAADDAGLSRRSRRAAGQTPGGMRAPVRKQCYFAIGQDFDFADNSAPPAMLAVSATAGTKRVASNSQRISVFQGFDWSVQ